MEAELKMGLASITRGMCAENEGESIISRVTRDRLNDAKRIVEDPRIKPSRNAESVSIIREPAAVEVTNARLSRVDEMKAKLAAVQAGIEDDEGARIGLFKVIVIIPPSNLEFLTRTCMVYSGE